MREGRCNGTDRTGSIRVANLAGATCPRLGAVSLFPINITLQKIVFRYKNNLFRKFEKTNSKRICFEQFIKRNLDDGISLPGMFAGKR